MFINPTTDNSLCPDTVDQDNVVGMKNVEQIYVNRLECPITLNIGESTFDDIRIHMIYRQRLSQERTNRLLIHAGTMANHPIVPINFLDPNYQNFIRHMDYIEQIENTTPSMLKYKWILMQKILTTFGIPFGKGQIWNYTPPSIPPPRPRNIPLPDQVYQLIHNHYSSDKYTNALVQYLLLHSFILGMRNPSEICMMKTQDIDLDKGTIIIREKKKHNRERIIAPPPSLLNSRYRKSYRNWIQIYRPLRENPSSDDYLYLRHTDGQPLSPMQITQFITRTVRPYFPSFQLYCTRHWCAIALLIREKINTDHWNKYTVGNHLGHEHEKTTREYIKYAEQYYKLAPYDWFKRVLKNHTMMVGVNTSEINITKKQLVLNGFSPVDSEITEQEHTHQQEGFVLIQTPFWGLLDFWSIFFFFSLDSNCLGVGC